MHYRVTHTTTYDYGDPVVRSATTGSASMPRDADASAGIASLRM